MKDGDSLVSCPECAELGIESPVNKIETLVEPGEVHVFRDEKGHRHEHDDKSEFCYVYVCALDHEIRVQQTGKACWCSWKPTELQKVEDAEELADFGIILGDSLPD